MRTLFKILGKALLILGGLYALLFAVFFFDLDGKALFYGVEPFLVKHYDKMQRRDPLKQTYETETPSYEYKV
ncbi:MAG: hypothetical protein IJL08_08650 [Oscillospiraceae bacterium]|nr:hypothetical protein [Oscillospiraceae bacterium]